MPSTNPLLGPLADNGGPTRTHALLAGSPAIDTAAGCPPPAADQRGVARPRGTACDIGAYEFQPAAATPTPSPSPAPSPTATPASLPETGAEPSSGGGMALLFALLTAAAIALSGAGAFAFARTRR